MEIKYKLDSIKESEYRFNYDFDYVAISPEKVVIQIGHEIKPLYDSDTIIISVKVDISHSDTGIVLAANTIVASFSISPIHNIISQDKKGYMTTHSSQIIDMFLATAIGALRGVLMKNLKGTPLEFVTIPLIPIENLRSEDDN